MVLWTTLTAYVAFAAAGRLPWLDEPMDSGALQIIPEDTLWFDALNLGVRGQWWLAEDLAAPYHRFPAKAQDMLCGNASCAGECPTQNCEKTRCVVWDLATTPCGLNVRFSTEATQVHVRWSMEVENGDWLWPINGHSGMDVYVQDENTDGKWRWATSSGNNGGGGNLAKAAAQPGKIKNLSMTLGKMGPGFRNFTLYFPARGSLESVEVGVAQSDTVQGIAPPTEKPIAIYGTSILHGAAAGRTGMVWSSQMERYIRHPVLNFGFSGHGLMQQEVGELLSEVDTSLFILDCEWNMVGLIGNHPEDWSNLACLTYDFIKLLRSKRPHARVLLIEGHDDTQVWIRPDHGANSNATRNGYREAFNRLLGEGETEVFYLDGSEKMGGRTADSFEAQIGAVGGVHPSSLAFTHFAHYVGDAVLRVLNGTEAQEKLPLLPVDQTQPIPAPEPIVQWMEASELGLEGLGWPNEEPKYGRLPLRAKEELLNSSDAKSVWDLSEATAGVLVRFETDADQVTVEVRRDGASKFYDGALQDDIMSWNGRFGVDIYGEDPSTGKWRWFKTSAGGSQQINETLSFQPATFGMTSHRFTVHFPTHVPVMSLRVGVPEGFTLKPYKSHKKQKPIVVWGSSIAQGGVVQNAGMPWPVSLGRLMDREVLNFGFSGNCLMQPTVAKYLVELKPEIFVVDCLPNMQAAAVETKAPPLFKQLRDGLGPDVPIVVLEGHTYTNAWILPSVQQQQDKRATQLAAFMDVNATDPNIHYVHGDGKLASLGENWYDATAGIGVHPSNIAHLRIAEYIASKLEPLLPAEGQTVVL